METAKFILSVLTARFNIWGSWAPHDIAAFNDAVIFRVQGLKFKGLVRVGYNARLDLFEVWFFTINPVTKEIIVHKEMPMLYIDQLVNVIDRYVEHTGATYDTDAKKAVAEYYMSDANTRLN